LNRLSGYETIIEETADRWAFLVRELGVKVSK
jgi:hypothetical protein